MKGIWVIARRELNSFFDSLMAYIIIIIFLGFTGFFTWIYGQDIFFTGQASLTGFFNISYWTLFFFIPALSMRLIAEERQSGTLELLLTKPVSDWQIITGKFLAAFLLISIAIGLSIIYYFSVWRLGNIDHGATITGYLGLLLMSAAYISIGIFASSITSNQIVAFLLSLFIGIFFHILFGIISSNFTGLIGRILDFLSMQTHFESISRGVIALNDLLYFGSLILLGLIGSELSLAKRNLSE